MLRLGRTVKEVVFGRVVDLDFCLLILRWDVRFSYAKFQKVNVKVRFRKKIIHSPRQCNYRLRAVAPN